MAITAKIIADSKNSAGNRITTFVLEFPRIVLAEFNTHRMISKNSASSRAIPFEKMLERVMNDPFIPIKWMKEHKGMQGTEYLTDNHDVEIANIFWHQAKVNAIEGAKDLSNSGVTKQICNRLLEPFLYHTVIATATNWENFFALRAHEAAEIHIQDLAYKMLDEYNISNPKFLEKGEWHIPFGDSFDDKRLYELNPYKSNTGVVSSEVSDYINAENNLKIKIATARCARVSYMNFEGKDDYNADIKLHDNLVSMGHFSPFEHCARAENNSDFSGNFQGFTQYRKMLKGENKSDNRVKKLVANEN